MFFPTLFNSLKSGGSYSPVQQPRRGFPRQRSTNRLGVEALEDRQVPASLSVSDVSILEGNSGTRNALVTVSLTGSNNGPSVSVNYSSAHGTASTGSDYQAVSGKLSFARGQTSKSILVPIKGDTAIEPDETFFVNLSGAKHATIADGQGVVTILNDDASISIFDEGLSEGNSGATNLVFTVYLSVANSQPVTVHYATANGTATAGSDYQAVSGTLTIPAGQTSGTIAVPVMGDQLSEQDESFFVNLSNPTNGTIADGQAIGTIYDDEPRISIYGISAQEGNTGTTEFNFAVSLSAASDVPVSVHYSTADNTATVADNDYVPASGTLTFAPGETSQTITVLVRGDGMVEYDEYFDVNLSSPNNAQLIFSQASGAILSDDNAVFHIDSVNAYEPDPMVEGTTTMAFTVWLSAPSNETVTVNFGTTAGTATEWQDYWPTAGTLTFAPGEMSQTIYVTLQADWEYEPDEWFYVNLYGPSSNALIQPGYETGVGAIYDFYYW